MPALVFGTIAVIFKSLEKISLMMAQPKGGKPMLTSRCQ
jgi:hypothetical protein